MLDVLSAINQTILREKSEDELYQQVCDAALRGGNFSAAAILVPESGTDHLRLLASGNVEKLDAAHAPFVVGTPGQSLAQTAFRTQKACVSDEVVNADHLRAQGEQEPGVGGACARAALPLLRGERTAGVLLVDLGQGRIPDDDMMALLAHVADNLSFALDNLDRNAERKASENATRRLARMFAALSATNEAILRAKSPEELYRLVCDAAVHGGKSLATAVMLLEPDSAWLKPVAGTGEIVGLLRQTQFSIDHNNPYGKGVCGTAFRTQKIAVNKDILNSLQGQPWRQSTLQTGVVACAALPLVCSGRSVGVLMFFIAKSWAEDEEILALLTRMAENVSFALDNFDQEAKRKQAEANAQYLATHDALTGLSNRVHLNEALQHALARAKRGEVIAVHLLDLDHFKDVNDTLGHAAGDKLLMMVADRLRSAVRETDAVARMGGDEFAILQVDIDRPATASLLALRIIESVSRPYDIDGHAAVIGTSVGIAIGPTDGTSAEQLMRSADLALYRAKADGRGSHRFFEPEMDAQVRERRAIERDLREALAGGEFELHYQPIVNLELNEVTGVEALIRWRHPHRGLLLPGAFIPAAEEIGVIVPLGEWVLRTACAAAATWPNTVAVSVNLSPLQFKNQRLVSAVVDALVGSGLAPERLELEITETALFQDSEATFATLYELRALGVRIALDDFGTGYSSLSYLQSFPFHKIKIDRSFVQDISEGVGSLSIVRAVTALAKGLGMTTTAEGVETQEHFNAVKIEGCTEMQGFLFSRPLPSTDLDQLLHARRTGANTQDGSAAA
jgi:diguanylate cyclase (GGDEF)-like protein